MSKEKELSKEQMKRRLERAVLHIDRTKDTKEVFFYDKGLRLIVTDEFCIVETGFHRHVFGAYNIAQGISRPYVYVSRFIDIALGNDCKTEKGYSYAKLFEVLKSKEDRTEHNIATYVDWWFLNIFQPLYSIGESVQDSFLVCEQYMHNIARNQVLLSEKTEDMTNKHFFKQVFDKVNEFINELDEIILFPKKTDEELAKENIETLQEIEIENQNQA